MLRSCCMQVARQDIRYREEVLSDMQRSGNPSYEAVPKKMWKRLFLSRFDRQSDRRVVLLLDGVDEADESSIKAVLEIVEHHAESDANIQIVFSSDPQLLSSSKAKMTKFGLSREMLVADMKIIATARMRQLSRLRKLRSRTKGKISRKICEKADGTLPYRIQAVPGPY